MKKIYLLLLLLLPHCIMNAYQRDSIIISGSLKVQGSIGKVVLKKFGVGAFEIASSPLERGTFKFRIGNVPEGVYRLQYGAVPNDHVDIILNSRDNDIHLDIDNAAPVISANFTGSAENERWHSYKQKITREAKDMEALGGRALAKLQRRSYAAFKKFLKDNKNSWAAEMVKNLPPRFDQEQLLKPEYRDDRFWDGLDASNADLLNTPLFTDQIFSYVKYYLDPRNGFSGRKKTEFLIRAAAKIMEKFGNNSDTQNFAFQFLSAGFLQVGEEEALQFLDETYGPRSVQCLGESDKIALQMRLGSYKSTKPGTPAKDFTFTDSHGKLQRISSMKSDKIILVFYASWCPHCVEEMPKINEWASRHPENTVVAISLDKDSEEFARSSKSYANVISYCDYEGWESQPALDYNIIGTPTFIVLDSDKSIIGKFGSFGRILAAGIIK